MRASERFPKIARAIDVAAIWDSGEAAELSASKRGGSSDYGEERGDEHRRDEVGGEKRLGRCRVVSVRQIRCSKGCRVCPTFPCQSLWSRAVTGLSDALLDSSNKNAIIGAVIGHLFVPDAPIKILGALLGVLMQMLLRPHNSCPSHGRVFFR